MARRPAPSRTDDLQRIPGVGPSIAQDLRDLGVDEVADLRGADPQGLYEHLCLQRGGSMDRCVLYVFRCAVYFAEHQDHDPELLKWWNWKDRKTPKRSSLAAGTRSRKHRSVRNG